MLKLLGMDRSRGWDKSFATTGWQNKETAHCVRDRYTVISGQCSQAADCGLVKAFVGGA